MNKALIVLAMIIGIGVTSALACGCMADTDSMADSVKRSLKSDAVFVGKVERFEYKEGIPDKEMEEYQKTHHGVTWKAKIAIFRVERWWTGSLGSEFAIVTNETKNSDDTGRLETSCAFRFELGKSYLVFTNRHYGYFRSPSNCGLTDEISRATAPLSLLGSGIEPVKDSPK